MELRPFRDADAPALTELIHRAYAELGRAGLNFTGVDQPVDVTRARASAGATWILSSGTELVACMTISWPPEASLAKLTPEANAPGRAWLNQLAVDPSYRGRGTASFLRDLGFAWCAEQGATSIGLDTAMPAEHLRALYAKWGFVETDEVQWPGKTYPSVIMTRDLPNAPEAFRSLALQAQPITVTI